MPVQPRIATAGGRGADGRPGGRPAIRGARLREAAGKKCTRDDSEGPPMIYIVPDRERLSVRGNERLLAFLRVPRNESTKQEEKEMNARRAISVMKLVAALLMLVNNIFFNYFSL